MRVKKRVALYGATLAGTGLVVSTNNAKAGVWQDGRDLKKEEYTGDNTAVTLLYKVVRDPVLGNYTNLGTGTFISPNVNLTVGHNYMEYEAAQPKYKNKLTPNTTFYYNLGTTNMDARQTYIPSDGISTRLGTTRNLSARFKHVDMNKFSTRNSDEINWQYDFNLVVTDTPMQFTSPNKQAEPLDLIERSAEDAARHGGYDIHYSGYMVDFEQGSDTNLVKNPNVTPGNLLSVRTKTNYSQNIRKGVNGSIITWNNTSGGGFSGSTLRNNQGKVIGVLNGGYNGKNGENMGLVFNNKTLNWIRQVIKENQINGWRDHNGQRYYFQDNGHLYRNTTQVINGVKWQFDENGVATKVVAKGTIKVKIVDNDGYTILEKLIIENQNEGTDYQFDANQDPIIKALLTNNQLKENRNARISGKVTEGEHVITITYEHNPSPTAPSKPKQTKPVAPQAPVQPTAPTKPTITQINEPVKSNLPVEPKKPVEPALVVKTNTPAKPVEPVKPIEPKIPHPVDKSEPIKPEQPKVEEPIKPEQPKVEKPVVKPQPTKQLKPIRKQAEHQLVVRRRKPIDSGHLSHRYYLRQQHQYPKHRLSVKQTRRPYESQKQHFHLATALHQLIKKTD